MRLDDEVLSRGVGLKERVDLRTEARGDKDEGESETSRASD